jgi:hypothetical protein
MLLHGSPRAVARRLRRGDSIAGGEFAARSGDVTEVRHRRSLSGLRSRANSDRRRAPGNTKPDFANVFPDSAAVNRAPHVLAEAAQTASRQSPAIALICRARLPDTSEVRPTAGSGRMAGGTDRSAPWASRSGVSREKSTPTAPRAHPAFGVG